MNKLGIRIMINNLKIKTQEATLKTNMVEPVLAVVLEVGMGKGGPFFACLVKIVQYLNIRRDSRREDMKYNPSRGPLSIRVPRVIYIYNSTVFVPGDVLYHKNTLITFNFFWLPSKPIFTVLSPIPPLITSM